MKRDEVFRHVAAGAGGWGKPNERDPEAVLEDVQDGKVSRNHAREAYGVVITSEPMEIDTRATAEIRRSRPTDSGPESQPPM